MRVDTIDTAYTLYTGVEMPGHVVWVMHVWRKDSNGGESWLDSVLDVSAKDPFKSTVNYDAWS